MSEDNNSLPSISRIPSVLMENPANSFQNDEDVPIEEEKALIIQSWYRQNLHFRHIYNKLQDSQDSIISLNNIIEQCHNKHSTYDHLQHLLFQEDIRKLFVFWLNQVYYYDLTQSNASSTSNSNNNSMSSKNLSSKKGHSKTTSVSILSKKLILAILIALFPMDIFMNTPPQSPNNSNGSVEFQRAIIACANASKQVVRCLRILLHKFLTKNSIDNVKLLTNNTQKLEKYFYYFNQLFSNFVSKFDYWKLLDEQITVQQLEEHFAQSYLDYIITKNQRTQVPPETLVNLEAIIAKAYEQAMAIKGMLLKILGPTKGPNRIEEICASIEASVPPPPSADASQDTDNGSLQGSSQDSRSLPPAPPTPTPTISNIPSVSSATPSNFNEQQTMKQLSMLSQIAGLENERLAYEITYDPNYRLPFRSRTTTSLGSSPRSSTPIDSSGSQTPLSPNTSKNQSFGLFLRNRMLRVMADRLVNSLRPSLISSFSEIKEGNNIPLYQELNPQVNKLTVDIFTAKVLRIYKPLINSSEELDKEHTSDGQTEIVNTPVDNLIFLEVEYLADNRKEANIPVELVKRPTDPPSPIPLLQALQDTCLQIASLTPSRKDLHEKLFQSFDPDLLSQMIFKKSFSPYKDLYPIMKFLYLSVVELQAEFRANTSIEWLKSFELLFATLHEYSEPSEIGNEKKPFEETLASVALTMFSGSSSSQRFILLSKEIFRLSLERFFPLESADIVDRYHVLGMLPVFFEHVIGMVEDIQRDMANYYISLLAPVLQTHGAEFLLKRFQLRLQSGQDTIQSTATWLSQTLSPSSQWDTMIADLLEAEVIHSSPGFSMQDLLQIVRQPIQSTSLLNPNNPSLLIPTAELPFYAILAKSFLQLLQSPVRLDSSLAMFQRIIPETMLYDGERLAKIRDLIDIIALECSIVILSRQILIQRYNIAIREEEEIELQHRLDVLLHETLQAPPAQGPQNTPSSSTSSSSSFSSVNFENLVDEVVKYMEFAMYRTQYSSHIVQFNNTSSLGGSSLSPLAHPSNNNNNHNATSYHPSSSPHMSSNTTEIQPNSSSPYSSSNTPTTPFTYLNFDPKELRDRVEKAIKDVISEGNPVLSLFTKRIYKVLLRALLNQPYLTKLNQYSLQSKGQERNLSKLVMSIIRLFKHNLRVYGDIYRNVLLLLSENLLSTQSNISEST